MSNITTNDMADNEGQFTPYRFYLWLLKQAEITAMENKQPTLITLSKTGNISIRQITLGSGEIIETTIRN